MSIAYKIVHYRPKAEEFIRLRESIGWNNTDSKIVEKSLKNSLFNVSIYDQDILVGVGRIVGDGYMYFYIQDVVVEKQYQGRGIGSLLMNEIEIYLEKIAKPGSTIGLLAAQGKEGFYLKYGYMERSGDPFGKGMCKFI